jgi:PleD family two-component response regulator
MIHKSNSSYREILEARARHTAGKPWTQGLHIVQLATPDLVITDVLLPETDGLEVTTAARYGKELRIASGHVGDDEHRSKP